MSPGLSQPVSPVVTSNAAEINAALQSFSTNDNNASNDGSTSSAASRFGFTGESEGHRRDTGGVGQPRKAQILLFPPILFESHLFIFKTLGKGLQEFGHHLTLYVSDRRRVENDSPDFSVARFPGIFSTDEAASFLQEKISRVLSGRPTFLEMFEILDAYARNCEVIFREGRESIEQLRQHKFDLVVVDSNEMCGFLIAMELQLPFVVFSTGMWTPYEAYVPSPISYVPEFNSKLTDRMSFLGRLHNTFMYSISRFGVAYLIFPMYDRLIRRYKIGEPKPLSPTTSALAPSQLSSSQKKRWKPMKVQQFIKASQAWLVCTDVALEFPRPMMPQVEYIGGILSRPPKALPLALKEWADASTVDGGFLIVSFGAGVQNLDKRLENIFVNVLSKLPYRVIWRYGRPIDTNATNIKVVDWFPQNDLLGHPNARAFIGHGGTNGVYECLSHAVPIVGMPLFGDHYDTMVRVNAKGMGIMMDWKTLKEDQFSKALNDILYNPKYAETIARFSKIHHDQLLTPLQRASRKIDYVIRYDGANHLRPAVFDLNLIQYFLIDVQLTILAATALLAYAIYTLADWAMRKSNNDQLGDKAATNPSTVRRQLSKMLCCCRGICKVLRGSRGGGSYSKLEKISSDNSDPAPEDMSFDKRGRRRAAGSNASSAVEMTRLSDDKPTVGGRRGWGTSAVALLGRACNRLHLSLLQVLTYSRTMRIISRWLVSCLSGIAAWLNRWTNNQPKYTHPRPAVSLPTNSTANEARQFHSLLVESPQSSSLTRLSAGRRSLAVESAHGDSGSDGSCSRASSAGSVRSVVASPADSSMSTTTSKKAAAVAVAADFKRKVAVSSGRRRLSSASHAEAAREALELREFAGREFGEETSASLFRSLGHPQQHSRQAAAAQESSVAEESTTSASDNNNVQRSVALNSNLFSLPPHPPVTLSP